MPHNKVSEKAGRAVVASMATTIDAINPVIQIGSVSDKELAARAEMGELKGFYRANPRNRYYSRPAESARKSFLT